MPFFALIGLITIVGIIINLQINRHSFSRKITGTIILIFAGVFACLAILYPLYFGSFQSLIVSFGVAFILLVGIFAAVNLLANRRCLKNVVFASAESPADISGADKTKGLAKPVQIRHAAPKSYRIPKAQTMQSAKNPVINKEKHPERFILSDSTETQDVAFSDVGQADERYVSGDEPDNAESAKMSKSSDLQPDMAGPHAKKETNHMAAGQSDVSIYGEQDAGDAGDEHLADENITAADEYDLQAEHEADDINSEQTDGGITAAEEANPLAEQNTDDIDGGHRADENVTAADEYDLQAEHEADDINSEQTDGGITAAEEADPQDGQETDNVDDEHRTGEDVTTADEYDPQTEHKVDDIDAKWPEDGVPEEQENKYAKVIAKANELKDQGKYLSVIFILRSGYQNFQNETVKKQADMLLLECLILSKQYQQAQKKWFAILNNKYDYKPEEKAKLKAMMAQLNSGRL